jgi:hypothetical protein
MHPYQKMSKAQNPLNMSGSEIYTYLNSGRYIPASLKKQLQEKLEFERKSNRFSALDEFYTMFASTTDKKKKKIEVVEYPSLPENKEKNTDSIHDKNVIDFNAITNQNSTGIQCDVRNSASIFVDDKLFLSYPNIKKMYDSYMLHRIMMRYYCIRRKINNLNLLSMVNPAKAVTFKSIFFFELLMNQKNFLEKYIKIYENLRELTKLYKDKVFVSVIEKYDNANDKIHDQCKKIKKLFEKIENVRTLIREYCADHDVVIGEYFKFAYSILDRSFDNTNDNAEFISGRIYENILGTINKIMKEIDSDVDCEYCVYLKNDGKSSTEPNIIIDGISTWTYICCDEEISTSYEFDDELLDRNKLIDITVNELDLFFRKKTRHDDSHYIRLHFNDQKPHDININFYIQDEIPKSKIYVQIKDLPKNTKIITSIIRNHDLDENINVRIVTPKNNHSRFWLNKKTNSLHKLTKKEYDMLNTSWKDNYSLNDTNKNKFVVDYLFNELLSENNNKTYITPDMYNSFKKMAFYTSNKTI